MRELTVQELTEVAGGKFPVGAALACAGGLVATAASAGAAAVGAGIATIGACADAGAFDLLWKISDYAFLHDY